MCNEETELIRYHFGEMTDEESAIFRERLTQEPELAKRLRKLEKCLSGSSKDQAEEAPPGLADRTADSVSDVTLADLQAAEKTYQLQRDSGCVQACRFSLVDASLAGFAFLLMGLIIAPAVYHMREASRRTSCQNNMMVVGRALLKYADENGGYFPSIGPNQNAGLFTLALADGGFIERDILREALICPDSELAANVSNKEATIWVPTLIEFLSTPDIVKQNAKSYMSGSYAYRIGYINENGIYTRIRKKCDDSRSPLISDAPSANSIRKNSPNHGLKGQHIFFQDGTIKFQTLCSAPCGKDHLFLNNDGEVAAGKDWHDTVLVRSEAVPWPLSLTLNNNN